MTSIGWGLLAGFVVWCGISAAVALFLGRVIELAEDKKVHVSGVEPDDEERPAGGKP